jgi:hypothetical protein
MRDALFYDWAGRSVCSNLNSPDLTAKASYEQEIVNTLISSSVNNNTQKLINQSLKNLRKHVDLMKPEQVKAYINTAIGERTKKPLDNDTKRKLVYSYDKFVQVNGLTWTKPHFKTTEITPIIPTSDIVTKIISASSQQMTTVFSIMKETGCNGEEIHKTPRGKIDTQQMIISIEGVKGHDSKAYKLTPQTNNMLINYLAKHPEEYPFPTSRNITRAWVNARTKILNHMQLKEVKYVQLRNLRNYSGAQFYLTHERDPIATQRHFRHKKLTRTQHYLKAIVLDAPTEYITIAIQLGQPDTQKQILEYSNAGYSKLTEADGYLYLRAIKRE